MRRSFLRWQGIELRPYPTMMFVGMVAGVLVGTSIAPDHGLAQGPAHAALLLLLAPSIIGSRLLYVGLHWRVYRRNPARIWRRSDGGLALYGGFLLTLVMSLPLLHGLGLSLAAFWDVAAVVILIGMAFTKVGCHVNGCCAGRPTSGWLGLRLSNASGVWARRIPSQLLEGALAAALSGLALAVHRQLPFDGALVLGAVMAYGVGRLALESTRETIDRVGRVSVNHLISASLAGAAAVAMAVAWMTR